jgi:hypothetical protein
MRIVLSVILLAASVAGCVSDQERLAQLAAIDDGKCQDYGAKPGTPPYVQCRAQLDAARTQADAAKPHVIYMPAPTPVYAPAPTITPLPIYR